MIDFVFPAYFQEPRLRAHTLGAAANWPLTSRPRLGGTHLSRTLTGACTQLIHVHVAPTCVMQRMADILLRGGPDLPGGLHQRVPAHLLQPSRHTGGPADQDRHRRAPPHHAQAEVHRALLRPIPKCVHARTCLMSSPSYPPHGTSLTRSESPRHSHQATPL